MFKLIFNLLDKANNKKSWKKCEHEVCVPLTASNCRAQTRVEVNSIAGAAGGDTGDSCETALQIYIRVTDSYFQIKVIYFT